MEKKQMHSMDFLNKIVSVLKKDAVENNESNKRVIIIRLLSLVMGIYFMALILVFSLARQYVLIAVALVCAVSYLVVLLLTYYNKSMVAYWVGNIVTLVWLILFVFLLGWDCGVQHFLFMLVVLTCFATFDRFLLKSFYISMLCVLRIGLYFYCRQAIPNFEISGILATEFQIINTVTIFLCIAIISLIASNYSQDAEKKLVLYNKKLEKMAHVDELTGLWNRRSMISYLESYDNINRECTDTIAIGDIDFFKKVNDQYGHECGDIVLKELSALLNKAMEGKGIVARWGGEEFLFVFEQINGDNAMLHMCEILQAIRSTTIHYQKWDIHITMTFGLEEYNGTNYEGSIKKADEKLYMGKMKGRDQVVY